MRSARRNTDAAIGLLLLRDDVLPVSASLGKIRSVVDSATEQTAAASAPAQPLLSPTKGRPPLPPVASGRPDPTTTTVTASRSAEAVGFHRIMVAFNALIANVTHVCIVQPCDELRRKQHAGRGTASAVSAGHGGVGGGGGGRLPALRRAASDAARGESSGGRTKSHSALPSDAQESLMSRLQAGVGSGGTFGTAVVAACTGGIGQLLKAYEEGGAVVGGVDGAVGVGALQRIRTGSDETDAASGCESGASPAYGRYARSYDENLMSSPHHDHPIHVTPGSDRDRLPSSYDGNLVSLSPHHHDHPLTHVTPASAGASLGRSVGAEADRGAGYNGQGHRHHRTGSGFVNSCAMGRLRYGAGGAGGKRPSSSRSDRPPTDTASALISLLLSFVRLKESTGVERAVLSSLMAMGEAERAGEAAVGTHAVIGGGRTSRQRTLAAEPLSVVEEGGQKKTPTGGHPVLGRSAVSKRLFSDLVLEQENRRKVARDLRAQAKRTQMGGGVGAVGDDLRSLLALIDQAVQPDPEMEDLHNAVLVSFDLEKFQGGMTMEDLWCRITVYIDRVHAVELLILEELECYLAWPLSAKGGGGAAAVGDGRLPQPPPASEAPLMPLITDDDDVVVHRKEKTQSSARQDRSVLKDDFMTTEEGLCVLLQSLNPSDGSRSREEVAGTISGMDPAQLKASLLAMLSKATPGGSGVNVGDRADGERPTKAKASTVTVGLEWGIGALPKEDEEEEVGGGGGNARGLPLHPLAPPSSASDPEENEWEIDPYEIEFRKRIGRGVAGTTYLAYWGGQKVAVKVAAITDMGLEGWNTEVRSLRRLHHPNIIRLLGSFYNPSPITYGLVLEFCDAGDLSAALRRWTPPNFFFRVAGDVANGMAYLHGRSILHRDIKPANVLLHGDVAGGNFTVKLADFGVAAITVVSLGCNGKMHLLQGVVVVSF